MNYAFRKKHINNLSCKEPTEQTQKHVTKRQQKFQIRRTMNATISNSYMLWKISICQNCNRETLPESMTTLDMSICQLWIISKSLYWLDRTTLTLSHQSEWNKGQHQHHVRVFSILVGLFLDHIQYWMTAEHNIQCIILLCFVAVASNQTMTSTMKFLNSGKQRRYRSKSKAKQMIQRFCLPTIYLTQHSWDKRMNVMKQDYTGKTTAVCQTTSHKLLLIWTILSSNYKRNLNSTRNTMRAFKQT